MKRMLSKGLALLLAMLLCLALGACGNNGKMCIRDSPCPVRERLCLPGGRGCSGHLSGLSVIEYFFHLLWGRLSRGDPLCSDLLEIGNKCQKKTVESFFTFFL